MPATYIRAGRFLAKSVAVHECGGVKLPQLASSLASAASVSDGPRWSANSFRNSPSIALVSGSESPLAPGKVWLHGLDDTPVVSQCTPVLRLRSTPAWLPPVGGLVQYAPDALSTFL